MKLIGAWWRKNRSAAPTLFDDELEGATATIAKQPLLGAVHEVVVGRTFRPILLRKTKQHVFVVPRGPAGESTRRTVLQARTREYILLYMKSILVELDDRCARDLERVAPVKERMRAEFIRLAVRRAVDLALDRATAEIGRAHV